MTHVVSWLKLMKVALVGRRLEPSVLAVMSDERVVTRELMSTPSIQDLAGLVCTLASWPVPSVDNCVCSSTAQLASGRPAAAGSRLHLPLGNN